MRKGLDIMTGIYGYYSTETISKNYEDIIHKIKKQNYTVKKTITDSHCILCSLGVRNEKNCSNEAMNQDFNIISCGDIYLEESISIEKAISDLFVNNDLRNLKHLNGSFAAAIYDKIKNELIICNDRNGSIKIFYSFFDGKLVFSPKIKPILELGAFKNINKNALVDFLLFGYPLGDDTLIDGIKLLPLGSILRLSDDGMKVEQYDDYYCGDFDLRSKKVLINELHSLWEKAVDKRVTQDKKNILLLSGGLDSRAILASVLNYQSKDNLIVATFGEKNSYDLEIGSLISQKLGLKNYKLPMERIDFEKQYIRSLNDSDALIDATPYYPVFGYQNLEKISNNVFSGYLGGELMGPQIFKKINNHFMTIKTDIDFRKKLLFDHHKLIDPEIIKSIINPNFFNRENILQSFEKSIYDLENVPVQFFPNYCMAWMYRNESYKCTSCCNFKYQNIFRYIDPFLDYELIDFMVKLPLELRMDKNLYKSMLINKYPSIFRFPTKNSYALPLRVNRLRLFIRRIRLGVITRMNKYSSRFFKKNILIDKLENYIDYNDLLRTNKEYRDFVKEKLDRVKQRVFFNQDVIETLWKNHMNGKKNYAKLFGLLVTFELFLEIYLE